ncbi:MAG: hypothetical protein M1826_005668 [Phylliscum demangeonii]|nr:MAG: hypothetical protein M1826_005668 [Phylliscum demangeonii]
MKSFAASSIGPLTLLALHITGQASAAAISQGYGPIGSVTASNTGAPSSYDLTSMSLPMHGAGLELPSPANNLKLQVVALATGHQKYCCEKSQSKLYAATATLYDASLILGSQPQSVNQLTSQVLQHGGPSLTLPLLGQHYFDGNGLPTFDLQAQGFFRGQKQEHIPAPGDADPGPHGRGAVEWLRLAGLPDSVHIQSVYRVATAGGLPAATCDDTHPLAEEPYAALYYMYG